MSDANRVWVDFNRIEDGCVIAEGMLRPLAVGTHVVAFDYDGNECPGVVQENPLAGLVDIKLDLQRFERA